MTTTPFLHLPDPTRPFRIDVDACNQHGRGKGAIILQQSKTWVPPPGSDLNNVEIPWTPVAYCSKKLTPQERASMGTTEVAEATIHDAILHWAPYLQNGVKFEVVVYHQALVYLTTAAAMSGNHKVMAIRFFSIGILKHTVLFYHKHGISELNDGIQLLRREGVEGYALDTNFRRRG
jgi:hypothetical protein